MVAQVVHMEMLCILGANMRAHFPGVTTILKVSLESLQGSSRPEQKTELLSALASYKLSMRPSRTIWVHPCLAHSPWQTLNFAPFCLQYE